MMMCCTVNLALVDVEDFVLECSRERSGGSKLLMSVLRPFRSSGGFLHPTQSQRRRRSSLGHRHSKENRSQCTQGGKPGKGGVGDVNFRPKFPEPLAFRNVSFEHLLEVLFESIVVLAVNIYQIFEIRAVEDSSSFVADFVARGERGLTSDRILFKRIALQQ